LSVVAAVMVAALSLLPATSRPAADGLHVSLPRDLSEAGPPVFSACTRGGREFACFDLENTRLVLQLFDGYVDLYGRLRLLTGVALSIDEDRLRLRETLSKTVAQVDNASHTATELASALRLCAASLTEAGRSPAWAETVFFGTGVIVGMVGTALVAYLITR